MKYAYILMYFITVIVGLFYRKKFWHDKLLQYWFFFVCYSFLNEVISLYILYVIQVRVVFLNNLWFTVNSLFYLLFFRKLIGSKRKRTYISIFLLVFVFYFGTSALFFKGLNTDYFIDTWILSQLFVVLSVLLFYTDVLNSNRILKLRKSMFFYISFGVLVFNLGLLPVYVIAEYIEYQGVFRYIILGVNIVLNASYVAGIIMSDRRFNNYKFIKQEDT